MSLTPIMETFGMVALLFIVVWAAGVRLAGGVWGVGVRGSSPPGPPLAWSAALRVVWLPAAAEAFALTLLAALWFGSLGSGGWVTLFLLVGALAAGADRWLSHRLLQTPVRQEVALFLLGLARYAMAGWLCAWRLT